MKIKELRKLLVSHYKEKSVIVRQPFELLKFKHIDRLEVLNVSGENEYLLKRIVNLWEVESKSRGQTDELKSFTNESDACNYLYKLLIDLSFQKDCDQDS